MHSMSDVGSVTRFIHRPSVIRAAEFANQIRLEALLHFVEYMYFKTALLAH